MTGQSHPPGDSATRAAAQRGAAAIGVAYGALLGAALERTLYRHLYNRPHLDQVMFTIGLVFMSVAAIDPFGARRSR